MDLSGTFLSRGTLDLTHDRPLEDQTSDREYLKVEARFDLSERLEGKLGLRLDRLAFYGNHNGREETRLEFWESYLRFLGKNTEVTVGNQIIRWGKADEITVLDNLTWQDLRELFTWRLEERERPWPWLRVQHFFQNFTLEGVFTLWPMWPKRDDFDSDWAVFDHLRLALKRAPLPFPLEIDLDKQKLSPSLRNSEFGLRLQGVFREVDWEISFLHAHNRSFYYYVRRFPLRGLDIEHPAEPIKDLRAAFPNLRILGNTARIDRPQDNILGFAFETTWRGLGLRGEFAYHTGRVFMKKDLESVQKPYWRYVLGLDYRFENGLYLNLQFLQQHILGWSEKILFDPEYDSYIFLRLSKGFLRDFLELRLDGTYGITTRIYYLNPEIAYKFRDNWELFGGFHLIDGPKGTFFDVYDNNDQVYLGLKISF